MKKRRKFGYGIFSPSITSGFFTDIGTDIPIHTDKLCIDRAHRFSTCIFDYCDNIVKILIVHYFITHVVFSLYTKRYCKRCARVDR